MALDFPSSPVNGQVYDNFIYDATKGTWKSVSSGASPNYLVNPTITDAVITATASTASTIPLTVNGAASQSANLQEWKNSAGIAVASISPSGSINAESTIVADGGGGDAVHIKSGTSNHAYISYFARDATPNTRTAYVGFGSSGGNTFTIANEIANSSIVLNSSYVAMPNQPSFRAYYNQLGSNPNGTLINFNVIEHNIGGHFNASNGRFTAPISGRYLMSFHAFRQDSQSGNWIVQYLVNGSIRQSRSYDDSDSSTGYGPNTAIVDIFSLSAGDYVNVNVQSGNLHGNDNCFFSGHFLG